MKFATFLVLALAIKTAPYALASACSEDFSQLSKTEQTRDDAFHPVMIEPSFGSQSVFPLAGWKGHVGHEFRVNVYDAKGKVLANESGVLVQESGGQIILVKKDGSIFKRSLQKVFEGEERISAEVRVVDPKDLNASLPEYSPVALDRIRAIPKENLAKKTWFRLRGNQPLAESLLQFHGIEYEKTRGGARITGIEGLRTHGRDSADELFFLHPDFPAHYQKLRTHGRDLKVLNDEIEGELGHYNGLDGLVVGKRTPWHVFKHEFDHFEFDVDIEKAYGGVNKFQEIAASSSSPLSEALKENPRLRQLHSFLNRGYGRIGASEALAYDTEIAELKRSGYTALSPKVLDALAFRANEVARGMARTGTYNREFFRHLSTWLLLKYRYHFLVVAGGAGALTATEIYFNAKENSFIYKDKNQSWQYLDGSRFEDELERLWK